MREAAVYVAVAFLPLALVAMVWERTAHWSRRLAEWLVAIILAKFTIAAAFALAASAIVDAPSSGGGLSALLAGCSVLLVAALDSVGAAADPAVRGSRRRPHAHARQRDGCGQRRARGGNGDGSYAAAALEEHRKRRRDASRRRLRRLPNAGAARAAEPRRFASATVAADPSARAANAASQCSTRMTERARNYRFGPLERRGFVGGLQPGQVGCLAGACVAAVVVFRLAPSGLGFAAAVGLVGLGAALSFVPIHRRPLIGWLPVVASSLRGRSFRSAAPTAGVDGRVERRAPRRPISLPSCLERCELIAQRVGDQDVGMLRDRRARNADRGRRGPRARVRAAAHERARGEARAVGTAARRARTRAKPGTTAADAPARAAGRRRRAVAALLRCPRPDDPGRRLRERVVSLSARRREAGHAGPRDPARDSDRRAQGVVARGTRRPAATAWIATSRPRAILLRELRALRDPLPTDRRRGRRRAHVRAVPGRDPQRV